MHTLRGTMLCFAAKIQEMYALGLVELKWQKKKKKIQIDNKKKKQNKKHFSLHFFQLQTQNFSPHNFVTVIIKAQSKYTTINSHLLIHKLFSILYHSGY